MRKVIVRCLFCICITYMVISSIFNTYYLINFNQNIAEFEVNQNNETHQVEVNIPKDTTVGNLIDLSNVSGKLEVIYSNFTIIGVSIILGMIIALTTLLKENSKIKFILIFILGYIIINSYFSFIEVCIFQSYGIEISFIEKYIDYMKYTIVPYTIIFLAILLIQRYFLKKRVNELNKIIEK